MGGARRARGFGAGAGGWDGPAAGARGLLDVFAPSAIVRPRSYVPGPGDSILSDGGALIVPGPRPPNATVGARDLARWC